MEWISILIVVASFFVSALIIILLSAIYLNIAEAVKKSGNFSMKNPPKPPPKRRLVSKCEYEEKETDEVNWRELYLEKKKERDFYEILYNKEKNANNIDEKCQRIKELESKVKALEIELEGVI